MEKFSKNIFPVIFVLLFAINAPVAQAGFLDMIQVLVAINPLKVTVSVPSDVELGKVFKVEAKIINRGEERIEDGEAQIFLPQGLILLEKNTVRKIKVIFPKREKKVSWRVRGEELGNYVISVSAKGELRDDTISAQGNTVVVTVQPKLRSSGSSYSFWQRFLDIFSIFLYY